jgi:mono/diheme cytochrome c family protein
MMRELWGPDRMLKGMEVRMKRHNTFMLKGVPEAYRTQHAMLPPTLGTIGESKDLYDRNCSTCHGADGMGDGDHANASSPSPALLAYTVHRPISLDEYLLWSVPEGGAAFGSNMPAFKDKLTPDEIWKVVTYMRAGFPSPKADRR